MSGNNTSDDELYWLVSFAESDDRELSRSGIEAALGRGEITHQTIVWRDGMNDWLPIADTPALKALAGGVLPPVGSKGGGGLALPSPDAIRSSRLPAVGSPEPEAPPSSIAKVTLKRVSIPAPGAVSDTVERRNDHRDISEGRWKEDPDLTASMKQAPLPKVAPVADEEGEITAPIKRPAPAMVAAKAAAHSVIAEITESKPGNVRPPALMPAYAHTSARSGPKPPPAGKTPRVPPLRRHP